MLRTTFLLMMFATVSLRAEEGGLRWFKGNTHTHSLWSDGNDFPEMISSWYRSQGYDFLAMSDHNVLARGDKWMTEEAVEKRKIVLGKKVVDKYRDAFGADWVETRNNAEGKIEVRLKPLEEYRQKVEKPGAFLLLEAEEISTGIGKIPVHINAINLSEPIAPLKDLSSLREVMRQNLQMVAEQALKTGKPMLAHVNHPNFQWALTAEDLAHVIEDRYFEVFNGHPKTNIEGDALRATSKSEKIWDVANTIRLAELKAPVLYGIASDDSHHYHGGDATAGRGWVMVRAGKLEADTLITAMQRGDFYCSTGVVLDEVGYDKATKKLTLKIKAEPGVTYVTEFHGTRRDYDRAIKEVPADPKDTHPVRIAYSEDVGKVLAKSDSLTPEYQLMGDELFVRATVISSKSPKNPVWEGQTEQAWTQPVSP